MHMIRYQPWGSFDLVDRLLAGHPSRHAHEGAASAEWVPAVDVKEETERFVIHADVPGVDPKDIEISMEDGVLTLAGERKSETRSSQDGWTRTERKTGRFLRRFTLPEGTDAEGINAQGSHGVLEIIIPKQAKAAARKISVKVN
jgi:HSP20 family protein